MFYTLLKERVTNNYRRTGGFIGLLGLISVITVLIVPPWVALEILDIPPFALMHLVVPGLWVAYLLPGSREVPERLHPFDALRLAAWPLCKA